MAEYVVSDYNLKLLWRGEAENDKEALLKSEVKDGLVYFAKNWDKAQAKIGAKPDKIVEVKVDEIEGTTDYDSNILITGWKPPRKPRSDIGQPRGKKVEDKPAKKSRNRGQFFVVTNLVSFKTRQELVEYLQTISADHNVIRGHELKFEKKVQFTLKPVK